MADPLTRSTSPPRKPAALASVAPSILAPAPAAEANVELLLAVLARGGVPALATQ